MTPRCWAEISGPALRHNLREARRAVAPGTAIMAMVKANAYGHGVLPVARECRRSGVEWLGVANVAEAAELRTHGFAKDPIFILSALLPNECRDAVELNVTPTISSLTEARQLARAASRAGTVAHAHFKIDTGMGRLGCWHEDAAEELTRIRALDNLSVDGLLTHFARADDNPAMTRRQWEAFRAVTSQFPDLPVHAANSEGLFRELEGTPGWVRPGIMLYGSAETPALRERLRPVLSWKTRITQIRKVPVGRTVSYGSTYKTRRAETHAVLGAGYADGYPRVLSNQGHVLVGGVRCPIRGRVTMDQILVDVTKVPGAMVGNVAVFIGRVGKERITGEELAKAAGTISYEIYTGISARVPRMPLGFTDDPEV